MVLYLLKVKKIKGESAGKPNREIRNGERERVQNSRTGRHGVALAGEWGAGGY